MQPHTPSFLPLLLASLLLTLTPALATAEERILDASMHHLRNGEQREWAQFSEQAQGAELILHFDAEANAAPQTLWVRQRDVKQSWKITVNGKEIGRLERDEKDITRAWPLPPDTLRQGENTLKITAVSDGSDDILVGRIRLDTRPITEVLHETPLSIHVTGERTGQPIPCRITIVNEDGSLISTGAQSGDHLAVRTGTIYTLTGSADLGLPAGRYTIHASRGFEYSLATQPLHAQAGRRATVNMRIECEVPTPGYVACDPHIHTVTHSHHGDATLSERMITIAAEGVELPVATEHNFHLDYDPEARRTGARQYFTPVIGNEVTTRVGHFNIFPVGPNAQVPDSSGRDWKSIFSAIEQTPGVRVVILNHGRDTHAGFRPLGPVHYNPVTGKNLDGWKLQINAMEVVNSGATMTDPMRLYRDWLGLLNRGFKIAPVGASDSHDVSRYTVGQARTYVKVDDDSDPASIDVEAASRNFAQGRVLVSYGLLAEITVEGGSGPGDLVTPDGEVNVTARVLGPSWTTADRITLYANGRPIREAKINLKPGADGKYPVVKWEGTWTLPRPGHDMHLAVIAMGPGETGPHWPIAKPYQQASIHWTPYVLGSTGAVYVDADGDGEFTSPHAYATRLVEQHGDDLPALIESLADYDQATAAQAAGLLADGRSPAEGDLQAALEAAAPAVRDGFAAFAKAQQQSRAARNP